MWSLLEKWRRGVSAILTATTVFCCHISSAAVNGELLFTPVANRDGDSRIRAILQLDDGRILFATPSGVEIFDGAGFSRIYQLTGQPLSLPAYDGFHHLYLSHSERYLWIKDSYSLYCLDLDTGIYATDVAHLLEECGLPSAPDDLFGDAAGRLWAVEGDNLVQPDLKLTIPLYDGIAPDRREERKLIDLAVSDDQLTLFFRDGKTMVYSLPDGALTAQSTAFPEDEIWKFSITSLVADTPEAYYQIRNGAIGALFRFDKRSGSWHRLLESNLRLNTLAVADSLILITTTEGLLSVERPFTYPAQGVDAATTPLRITHSPRLRTQSGKLLASEVSTVTTDREGGVWIGTLNRGLLYYNPRSFRHFSIPRISAPLSGKSRGVDEMPHIGQFFSEGPDGTVYVSDNGHTRRLDMSGAEVVLTDVDSLPFGAGGEYGMVGFLSSDGSLFFNNDDSYELFIRNSSVTSDEVLTGGGNPVPFISAFYVNGERTLPLRAYDGNVVLNRIPARQKSVRLNPDQNFLTFEVTLPVFTPSEAAVYYKLDGVDREWNKSTFEEMKGKRVRATYPALSPGEYTFRAKSSMDEGAPEATLDVEVLPPWWATVWAIVTYVVFACCILLLGMRLYLRRTKRKIEAEQREHHLLERIRQLIEEVDRYKASEPANTVQHDPAKSTDEVEPDHNAKSIGEGESPEVSEADREFIAKAVEIVERNLGTPGYSVAQLSSDLCMDRTGLYRKLTTLLDRSPSLFIRDIRLRNAARLLEEGKLSVTEIAERTGFSTPSYMSKCFQERYGCKPSEYASLLLGRNMP